VISSAPGIAAVCDFAERVSIFSASAVSLATEEIGRGTMVVKHQI
jgi:hypothetical protein